MDLTDNIRLETGNANLIPELERDSSSKLDGKDMSFKDLLKGLVDQVDTLQKEADVSIRGLATGQTTDVHNVAIRMEEAGVAFDLMMGIRNKLLEAYQEISRMQP